MNVSDRLLKYTTLRPRSEKEIRDWLKRKKVEEKVQKELFSKLTRLELVDDKKFTEWWVGQRIYFKLKSKRDIEYELRNKGIKKEMINQVLENTEIDEEKTARELLEKKAYKWKNLPSLIGRQKMSEFLIRKGFEWQTVKAVVKRFLK